MLAALLALPGPAAAQAQIGADQVLKEFDQIAFRSEHGTTSHAVVRKWTGKSILIGIQGKVPQAYADAIAEQLRVISQHAQIGFEIKPFKDGMNEQISLFFVPHKMFGQIAGGVAKDNPALVKSLTEANCFFINLTANGVIRKSFVALPSDAPDALIRHCIAEELTQAMGLENDSKAVALPSIFNPDYREPRIADKDKLFLRLLYDPALTPGLPREDALAKAKDHLKALAAKTAK